MSSNYIKFDSLEAEVDNIDGRLIAIRSKKRGKRKSIVASYAENSSGSITGLVNPKTGGGYGNEIRAAMQAARGNNCVELAPWCPAPTYATSTVYGSNAIVRGTGGNADNLYQLGGSTSAINGSGTSGTVTPPTGTGSAPIIDNTCVWFYIGKVKTPVTTFPLYSSVIPSTPASVMDGFVANGLVADMATIGLHEYKDNLLATPFTRVSRNTGYEAQVYLAPKGGNTNTFASPNNGTGTFQGFFHLKTNAKKWFGLRTAGITQYTKIMAIEVNGRMLSEADVAAQTSGKDVWILNMIPFPDEWKDIKLYFSGAAEYCIGVYMQLGESVVKPSARNNLALAIDGDSVTNGGSFGASLPRCRLANRIANLLGFDNYFHNAVGGTAATHGTTTYAERIRELVATGPFDVVIVNGFTNELDFIYSATRRAAMLAYFRALRAALPMAHIVVLPAWPLGANAIPVTLATGAGGRKVTGAVSTDSNIPVTVSGTLPAELVPDKIYYAISSDGSAFNLSLNPNGAQIVFTSTGSNVVVYKQNLLYLGQDSRLLASYYDVEVDCASAFAEFADANSSYRPLLITGSVGNKIPSSMADGWNYYTGSAPFTGDGHPISRFYPMCAELIADTIRNYYQVN